MTDRPGSGRFGAGSRRAARAVVRAGLRLGPWPLLVALVGTASAHSGSLAGATASATVPTWLTVLTGGIVVGATFLFTTLLTDHDAMRDVNWWRVTAPLPANPRRALVWTGRVVSVGTLALVLVTGLTGTTTPTQNFALLAVWAGWWAGYTMTTYLVGNSWPLVNPWRTLATLLPSGERPYPDRYGPWPAVVGLLALVYVEVVSPVASDPVLLVTVVLGYTVATLAGAAAFGPETWFGRIDPISRVFRAYGALAPVQRTDDGVALRLPGAALVRDPLAAGGPAFVVALLWVTTYDGFVATPAWASLVRPLVGAGVPALLVYLLALVAGYALFLGAYRLAARAARRTGDSYVTSRYIERWFAASLLPIAAGYHVAHFLSYFLTLAPALGDALATPFAAPATVTVLVLPGWFGVVGLLFVVVGHMLAVWVGHALAFDLFTGRLQPIRSQYPFIVAMVCYTVTSMWIVAQPFSAPPFV
jgi:hypothetical protein